MESSFLGVWRFIGVFFLSNLGFVSDFEFRISEFSARAAVSVQKDMGHGLSGIRLNSNALWNRQNESTSANPGLGFAPATRVAQADPE
jgi:hypothetical protein